MKRLQFGLGVSLLACLVRCAPTHQFDQFFPGWNPYLQDIIRDNCSRQHDRYLKGEGSVANSASSAVTPLIDCILNEFPEFRKAELGASTVVLGLMPTILQSLGSTTAETAVLARRRPFLALLLAGGSPAVNMARGSEFLETLARFVEGGEASVNAIPGLQMGLMKPFLRPWVSVLEYLVVGGAVANVVHLAYRLGVNAVVGFAPETIFMMPLWTFLAVIIHLIGSVVLHLRVQAQRTATPSKYQDRLQGSSGFPSWVLDEFVPCAFQAPKFLEWRPRETLLFPVLAWLLNLGILVHVVLGTLIMSSLLFFSVVDSVLIVARFTASAIACRTVVRFELAGITESMAYRSLEEHPEEELSLGRN
ncbi:hypothetical protein B0J13DRAFT_76183 [Dactylonectria estremocensis]|uniref:Uncharacterized protein n=1 Tax=Dactylonectria estremocensis TaxID=1079267 RepID=A0A9P9J036_9HYPO|nr:hypothetical protein B0J13DRAFT_76183 [Dactylonectria estremocensis]